MLGFLPEVFQPPAAAVAGEDLAGGVDDHHRISHPFGLPRRQTRRKVFVTKDIELQPLLQEAVAVFQGQGDGQVAEPPLPHAHPRVTAVVQEIVTHAHGFLVKYLYGKVVALTCLDFGDVAAVCHGAVFSTNQQRGSDRM